MRLGKGAWLTELSAAEADDARPEDIYSRLVSRASAGDAEAFRVIFDRYSKPVLSFIYNMIGDRGHAEELAQETFVRAYCRLGSMRDQRRLSSWLFGIARNVVREAHKRKQSERSPVSLEDQGARNVADRRPDPEFPLLAGELNRAIRQALAGLSEDGRAVFVLKVIHRMRYEEIARITGCSVGKLKTDLHRARLQMRRRLMHFAADSASGTGGGP
jgi:RNA polymerase sigma-70 factor (ECF subfamily)